MLIQALATSGASTKAALGPSFSKEAAALLAGATTLPANALEGVSHAMKFR